MSNNTDTELWDLLSATNVEVEAEALIIRATELLLELMESSGFSRTQLASALGKSKGHVSQLLNGSRNMTLQTLAELAYALGYQVRVEAERLEPTSGHSAPERLAGSFDESEALSAAAHDALHRSRADLLLRIGDMLQVVEVKQPRIRATTGMGPAARRAAEASALLQNFSEGAGTYRKMRWQKAALHERGHRAASFQHGDYWPLGAQRAWSGDTEDEGAEVHVGA